MSGVCERVERLSWAMVPGATGQKVPRRARIERGHNNGAMGNKQGALGFHFHIHTCQTARGTGTNSINWEHNWAKKFAVHGCDWVRDGIHRGAGKKYTQRNRTLLDGAHDTMSMVRIKALT